MNTYLPPLTVGAFLKEEFMTPLGLSAYKLAKDINVPVSRIQEILANRRKLSMDSALLNTVKLYHVSLIPPYQSE